MTAPAVPVTEDEARAIATEAYIYGYPLVTMDMTRRIMTNVPAPNGMRGPMGQFLQAREYPPANYRDVTAPNADTLYSVAWLDLGKEPWILHVPDEDGRYYLMPMLSGWTNVFADPGTRTTGTKARDFAITGPGWNGTLPRGVSRYACANQYGLDPGPDILHGHARGLPGRSCHSRQVFRDPA